MQGVLAMEHAIIASAPVAEPMREEEKEEEEREFVKEDRRKGSSSPSNLVPRQVLVLQQAMPMGPGFWFSGQNIWVARHRLPASSKALGKVSTMQVVPLPLETEKELVQWL